MKQIDMLDYRHGKDAVLYKEIPGSGVLSGFTLSILIWATSNAAAFRKEVAGLVIAVVERTMIGQIGIFYQLVLQFNCGATYVGNTQPATTLDEKKKLP